MVIFTEQILNGELHFLMQWMFGCRLGFLVQLIISVSLHHLLHWYTNAEGDAG